MKLKVIATDVVEQCVNKDYEPLIIEMEYNEDTDSLGKIRDKIGAAISGISFEQYYNDGMFRFLDNTLPYIIKNNGKIEFVPNIDNTLISEFISTHQISSDIIRVEYGFPQVGGPGEIDWELLWNTVWNAIEMFSTIGGMVGFVDFIKNKFFDKKPKPNEFIEYLYKRDCWNHNELAQIFDINQEQAKYMLKGFGYVWDKNKKMYTIAQDTKNNIRQNINNTSYLDK